MLQTNFFVLSSSSHTCRTTCAAISLPSALAGSYTYSTVPRISALRFPPGRRNDFHVFAKTRSFDSTWILVTYLPPSFPTAHSRASARGAGGNRSILTRLGFPVLARDYSETIRLFTKRSRQRKCSAARRSKFNGVEESAPSSNSNK